MLLTLAEWLKSAHLAKFEAYTMSHNTYYVN